MNNLLNDFAIILYKDQTQILLSVRIAANINKDKLDFHINYIIITKECIVLREQNLIFDLWNITIIYKQYTKESAMEIS